VLVVPGVPIVCRSRRQTKINLDFVRFGLNRLLV
jgi:hypothetical protein